MVDRRCGQLRELELHLVHHDGGLRLHAEGAQDDAGVGYVFGGDSVGEDAGAGAVGLEVLGELGAHERQGLDVVLVAGAVVSHGGSGA